MAKFSGEVTFRVKFKGLGVPVGFGMTNAIIFHECATQIYVRFEVEVVNKRVTW
jgi:hypothetical protein